MRAAALIYPNATNIPGDQRHLRKAGDLVSELIKGAEAYTWDAAKIACPIPKGAMILSWQRID
ncbi:hypothetical protein [Leucobacter chromiiresistens]|uniref:Uncharacterized protein n=1 Tax=Leucobacter chromiiresistens TaxID=1079994 RepID=A0A1H0ZZR3_9MICO|nr:hypothetical protein [Leucobacter chromiiresistens]SDQ32937.1 hypothetical protein SAMN04488565_2213 [Leucobacter chromiiresistens]